MIPSFSVYLFDVDGTLVTTGGVVPKGNPDHIKRCSETRWRSYDLAGRAALSPEEFERCLDDIFRGVVKNRAKDGSFYLMDDHGGIGHYLVAVRTGYTTPYIQTQFGAMKTQPPFDDDSKREALGRRLSEIDGVDLVLLRKERESGQGGRTWRH